jgi:hypothetical protein
MNLSILVISSELRNWLSAPLRSGMMYTPTLVIGSSERTSRPSGRSPQNMR